MFTVYPKHYRRSF